MKKKIIIAISVLVILIGAGFGYQALFGEKDSSFSTVAAEIGEITEKVSATGSLVPEKRIKMEPEVQKKVKNVFVDVSDKVKKGALLIQLADEEAYNNVSKARSGVNTALNQVDLLQTQVKNAERNLDKVKASTDQSIEKAKSEVRSASTTLASKKQNLEDVKRQQKSNLQQAYEDARNTMDAKYIVADEALLDLKEIESSYFSGGKQIEIKVQDKIDRAEDALEGAKQVLDEASQTEEEDKTTSALDEMKNALELLREALSYTRNEAMEDPRFEYEVSSTDKSTLDTHKSNVETAISSIISARQSIESQEITHRNSINTAQSQLNSAQSSLASAKSNLSYIKLQADEKITQAESNLSQVKQELEVKKSQLKTARLELEQALESLKDTAIKAPVAGTITRVDIEEGETAKPGTNIVNMIPESNFKIEADVSEVDIGDIEQDDEVLVDFDAFPRENYTGKVTKIHPAEIVKEGVIYYRIEVQLDEYPEKLKSGLTANLDIISAREENALMVPYVALRSEDGTDYVEVLTKDGEVEKKDVTLGIEGEMKVEIKKGLKESEKVIISNK